MYFYLPCHTSQRIRQPLFSQLISFLFLPFLLSLLFHHYHSVPSCLAIFKASMSFLLSSIHGYTHHICFPLSIFLSVSPLLSFNQFIPFCIFHFLLSPLPHFSVPNTIYLYGYLAVFILCYDIALKLLYRLPFLSFSYIYRTFASSVAFASYASNQGYPSRRPRKLRSFLFFQHICFES